MSRRSASRTIELSARSHCSAPGALSPLSSTAPPSTPAAGAHIASAAAAAAVHRLANVWASSPIVLPSCVNTSSSASIAPASLTSGMLPGVSLPFAPILASRHSTSNSCLACSRGSTAQRATPRRMHLRRHVRARAPRPSATAPGRPPSAAARGTMPHSARAAVATCATLWAADDHLRSARLLCVALRELVCRTAGHTARSHTPRVAKLPEDGAS